MKQLTMNIIPKLINQKFSQKVLPNNLTTTYYNTKGRNIIMSSTMTMNIRNTARISALFIRCSSSNNNNNHRMNISSYERREYFDGTKRKNPKRVWRAELSFQNSHHNGDDDEHNHRSINSGKINNDSQKTTSIFKNVWYKSIDDNDLSSMRDVVNRISEQEKQGGRMRQRKLGVLSEDPKEDMRLLIENYTVPAMASALRDREDVLQHCAALLAENKIDELREVLRPYEKQYVDERRQEEVNLNLMNGFDVAALEVLRKGLNRMPRQISQAHQRRAGVVIPLCNIDGVPCILFEKRSPHLRAHPNRVCLPGGMVSNANDRTIVATSLREMQEEIGGIDIRDVTVLGVLRCNWGEVHHLVGVAVTPVVCFIGDITNADLNPNPDEVAECFTVPLDLLLDSDRWLQRKEYAPMFTGGPYPIWGLTGYIINRFVKDVLAQYRVQVPTYEQRLQQKFRP